MDDATAISGTAVFNTWDKPCCLNIILGKEFQKPRYANLSSKHALRNNKPIRISGRLDEKLAYS